MENSLSIKKIDQNEIVQLLENMDVSVQKAHKTVNDLKCSKETLESYEYDELIGLELSISKEVKAAEEARKEFKRKWEAPLKDVEKAFNAEIIDLKNLHADYKAERVRRDEAAKQFVYNNIYNAYLQLLEDNDLTELEEVIPFERIFEQQWTNKTFGEVKAVNKMTEKVFKILNDYKSLLGIQLKCPEETRARFIECLDLAKSLEFDSLKAIQKEQDRKLKERIKPVEIEEERIPVEPEEVPPVASSAIPWVAIVYEATTETITKIAKEFSKYGVEGQFLPGTIEEVYKRVGNIQAY